MAEFNLELAKQLTEDSETSEFSVDFEELWQWCGYSKKDKAKDQLTRNFEEDLDYIVVFPDMGEWASSGGFSDQPPVRTIEIWTTTDCAKEFGMLAKTEKGKQVRKYFIKAEKELRRSMKKHPEQDSLDVLGEVVNNLKYQRDLLKAQQKQITENTLDIVDVQKDVDDLKTKIDNARHNPSALQKQKFTINQFSRMQNMIGSVGDHISAGKKLTKMCRILDIEFNETAQGNEYPYWLLEAIFSTVADYQISFEVLIKKYLVYWAESEQN